MNYEPFLGKTWQILLKFQQKVTKARMPTQPFDFKIHFSMSASLEQLLTLKWN